MILDTPTLMTSLMLVEFVGALILTIFWLICSARGYKNSLVLVYWAVGFFLAGCGIVLVAMRGTVADFFSISLANALIIFGFGLRRSGLAVFLGQKPLLWVSGSAVVLWMALYFYPPFSDSFMLRVCFVQAWLMSSSAWTAWIAFHCNKERLYSLPFLGITALIETSGYMWVTAHQVILQYPNLLDVFAQNFMTVYVLILMSAIVMSIVAGASMLLERTLLHFKTQAYRDPLTGLPNRRAFFENASLLHGTLQSNDSFAVIQFDLDNFKRINDSFGHSMGDAVLKLFGTVCREVLGRQSVAGRLGGDEFAVFCSGAGAEEAAMIANRIKRRFAIVCQDAADGRLDASLSAGICHARSSETVERALEIADRATYQAKKQGRDQIVILESGTGGKLSVADSRVFGHLKPGSTNKVYPI